MPSAQSHTHRLHHGFALPLVVAAAAIAIAASAVHGDVSLTVPTASRPAANLSPLTLTDRVLPASSLPGFIKTADPAVTHGALSWAATAERPPDPISEAQRLRRLGFISGVDEHLHGRFPLPAEAVSVVERFPSPAGARAELAYQRHNTFATAAGHAQTVTRLRDIPIPGAFGWVVKSPHVTGINVMFSDGPYDYLIGSGAAPGTHGAPTQAQIIDAAQFVNLIVNRCVSRRTTAKATE
jgi:hypothetical protein